MKRLLIYCKCLRHILINMENPSLSALKKSSLRPHPKYGNLYDIIRKQQQQQQQQSRQNNNNTNIKISSQEELSTMETTPTTPTTPATPATPATPTTLLSQKIQAKYLRRPFATFMASHIKAHLYTVKQQSINSSLEYQN